MPNYLQIRWCNYNITIKTLEIHKKDTLADQILKSLSLKLIALGQLREYVLSPIERTHSDLVLIRTLVVCTRGGRRWCELCRS